MVNPSFQIGQNIGAFEAKRIDKNEVTQKTQKDMSIIEQELKKARYSKDPALLQDTMTTILTKVSKENQPAAIKFLEDSMKRIDEQEKEAQARQAAQQGRYTYGAHPTVQAQEVRNLQPKQAPGGLTGQSISPELSSNIEKVIQSNPELNAEALTVEFDKAGVPRIYSNAFIETRRRQDETRASNEREDKKMSRSEILQFHKESEKYDEELLSQSRIAKKQVETVSEMLKAVNSGNIRPTSLANMFKGFGKLGDKFAEAFLNKDEATLSALIPELLPGWKEVFGVRLSDADLKLLLDKLPSIGKNAEANKAILGVVEKYADMALLREQIGSNIKKMNKGLRPLGFASQVEERFNEMTTPVKIINPNNGKTIEIPAYKLSDALRSGAKLANEEEEQ